MCNDFFEKNTLFCRFIGFMILKTKKKLMIIIVNSENIRNF